MGIVIRVLYNNKDWKYPCKYPSDDSLCSPCLDPKVKITGPKPGEEKCSGHCWEREICSFSEWGAGKHKHFGKRAQPGMKVFFVFKQPEGTYTLWGKTTVDSVNVPPKGNKSWSLKEGYVEYIRFHSFEPLPKDKWVADLSDIDLVDKPLKQGRYRFITSAKEAELEKRIEGLTPEKLAKSINGALPPDKVTFTMVVSRNIYGKLESVANEDGRQIDEIVREAIAEWLKVRSG